MNYILVHISNWIPINDKINVHNLFYTVIIRQVSTNWKYFFLINLSKTSTCVLFKYTYQFLGPTQAIKHFQYSTQYLWIVKQRVGQVVTLLVWFKINKTVGLVLQAGALQYDLKCKKRRKHQSQHMTNSVFKVIVFCMCIKYGALLYLRTHSLWTALIDKLWGYIQTGRVGVNLTALTRRAGFGTHVI